MSNTKMHLVVEKNVVNILLFLFHCALKLANTFEIYCNL